MSAHFKRNTIWGLIGLIVVTWWLTRPKRIRRLRVRIEVLERELFPEWFPRKPKTWTEYVQSYKPTIKPTNMQQIHVNPYNKAKPRPSVSMLLDDTPLIRCGACDSMTKVLWDRRPFEHLWLLWADCHGCGRLVKETVSDSALLMYSQEGLKAIFTRLAHEFGKPSPERLAVRMMNAHPGLVLPHQYGQLGQANPAAQPMRG